MLVCRFEFDFLHCAPFCIITSFTTKGRMLCFRSVCLLDYSKVIKDFDEIFWSDGCGPRTKWLDFGGDPDQDPDPGIFSRIYTEDCIKSVLFAR